MEKSKTKKVLKKSSNRSNKNTISRTEATNMILNSQGRFMKVVCKTKNGSINVMNCVKPKGSPTKLGYIIVTEVGQGKKSLDPRTLSKLSLDNKEFNVR